jgi:protocatechuate 3,4-dioxygenase beta subunit/Tfp pilus assembly protein PilF
MLWRFKMSWHHQFVWILLSAWIVAGVARAQDQASLPPQLQAALATPSEQLVPQMIRGRILDENQQPLAGVKIVVLESNVSECESKIVGSATSNSIGRYQIPLGDWTQRRYPKGKVLPVDWANSDPPLLTVVAKSPGRASFRIAISSADAVNRGDVTDIMMPPAAALRGMVATADGTPVEGALVSATVGAARPRIDDGIFQARTDALGQYQIADLIPFSQDELAAPGRPVGYGMVKWSSFPQYPLSPVGDENQISIIVEHPDFAVNHVRCQRIPGRLDVNLDPTASLSGRVVGIAGAPVAGALVYLESGENWLHVEDGVQRAYFGTARTDAEGHFSFRNLPTGVYLSSARVGRYVHEGSINLKVKAGETTVAPDIIASSPRMLRVRLIDDITGQPLSFDEPFVACFMLQTGAADQQISSVLPVPPTGDHFVLRPAAGDFRLTFLHIIGEDGPKQFDPIPFQVAGTIDVESADALEVSFRLRAPKMAEEGPNKLNEAIEQARQHVRSGGLEQAIELLDKLIGENPNTSPALLLRAEARSMSKQYRAAIDDYTTLLAIEPPPVEGIIGRNNLAFILATSPDENLRDGRRAVELALEALRLAEPSPPLCDTVAAAYAEAGNFPEAIKWIEQASALDPENSLYQRRLQLYRENKPLRYRDDAEAGVGAIP